MSSIYIQEPPTSGKVLLHTTVGDIDIELWCKETPKACRNFIQLCMENYFNKSIFHRVVKGFIVQGGDPCGDGTGGESIYGQPFKDEFHSRLRFVRRGLVAMANSSKDDNASQFFFTLAATPELQNKNTIFGKVTGNTLYNMLKLEEGLVDQDDRPIYPHKIISCEVLLNPFSDIVPRVFIKVPEPVASKSKDKVKKNFKLLSFGEEAEEDEEEMNVVNKNYKGQSKSSHDLTNDPKLSSKPAIIVENDMEEQKTDHATVISIREKFDKASSEKVTALKDDNVCKEKKDTEQNKENSDSKRKEIQEQIKQLKKELRNKKIMEPEEEMVQEESSKEENSVLYKYHETCKEYGNKLKSISRKGTAEREAHTLKILEKFKKTLETAKETTKCETKSDSDSESEDGETWLVHCLRAEDEKKSVSAIDANLPSTDRYDISDPRNPITERRRKEKKQKILK